MSDFANSADLPPEYYRVTNPERFSGLHALADAAIERLVAEFDVDVDNNSDASEMFRSTGSRNNLLRSVTISPRAKDSAELLFMFTDFPGLIVFCGNHTRVAFPLCGCDACAETFDDEARRFASWLDDVTHGKFREVLPRCTRKRLERDQDVEEGVGLFPPWVLSVPWPPVILFGRREYSWRPWPKRKTLDQHKPSNNG